MAAKFLGYEQCPKCSAEGRDRRGDNLGVYSDGSSHCFSCGYHRFPKRYVREVKEVNDEEKQVLPADFTREVPAEGWKWLLQWGLPYTYWKPYTGYSPKYDRLVLTFGEPIRFSQGRYLGNDPGEKGADGKWIRRPPRKWHFWGDGHGYVEILEPPEGGQKQAVVLVEDLVSAHKVRQVAPALCLFGTNIHNIALQALIETKRPVTLWLDQDQLPLLAPKINRLQTFLRHPVGYVSTEKDPKAYSLEEIKGILK